MSKYQKYYRKYAENVNVKFFCFFLQFLLGSADFNSKLTDLFGLHKECYLCNKPFKWEKHHTAKNVWYLLTHQVQVAYMVCVLCNTLPYEATAVVNMKKSNKVRTQTGMIAQ